MSSIAVWLEERAKEWIAHGEKRVPVRMAPPVGWAISGLLHANGSQANAVQLQVSFAQQMQTHTIQFDGPDSNIDAGLSVPAPSPVAEILWQVNGITNRRLVDVLDGQSVSGLAQSLTVNVRDTAIGGNGAAYRISIAAVPGVRASTDAPPTLTPFGVTSPGGLPFKFGTSAVAADQLRYTLPSNAGIVSHFLTARYGAGVVDSQIEIQYRAANLGIIATYDGSIRNRWVPMPLGTNQIWVVNNSATTISAFLTLGIDG
jgi:hypothetical protein